MENHPKGAHRSCDSSASNASSASLRSWLQPAQPHATALRPAPQQPRPAFPPGFGVACNAAAARASASINVGPQGPHWAQPRLEAAGRQAAVTPRMAQAAAQLAAVKGMRFGGQAPYAALPDASFKPLALCTCLVSPEQMKLADMLVDSCFADAQRAELLVFQGALDLAVHAGEQRPHEWASNTIHLLLLHGQADYNHRCRLALALQAQGAADMVAATAPMRQ